MSKIEAGRVDLKTGTFNISRLLDDLASMFRLRADAKALQFEMAIDGEIVPYVMADEGKMRQVLINLLGNAVKFTQRGRIELRVAMEVRSSHQLWLSARVKDTGPGIADEEQEKLFEAFTQAKRGHSTQEGTGLGLTISRKYARLMGGDLTVESRLGSGSVFRLEIPIERGDAKVAVRRSTPRRVVSLRAETTAPRILVVDDQLENRDWLMKLLTAIGFSVRGADNGEAALKNWKDWNPGMILMDVHMPVMDGNEATRRIKADPRGEKTVIVALTASALDEDRRTVFESGADDFLAKPCREDELLEKVRTHLNVTYDYEEITEVGPGVRGAALTAYGLSRLSSELVGELRKATEDGNKRLLDQLILKVREANDAESAEALQELVDKYEYDTLIRFLDEATCPS
jgi:two-component system sensor histidine kinase/response regulator